jgi:hypothetical protein
MNTRQIDGYTQRRGNASKDIPSTARSFLYVKILFPHREKNELQAEKP